MLRNAFSVYFVMVKFDSFTSHLTITVITENGQGLTDLRVKIYFMAQKTSTSLLRLADFVFIGQGSAGVVRREPACKLRIAPTECAGPADHLEQAVLIC